MVVSRAVPWLPWVVAAALVVACSSSSDSGGAPGDDGGVDGADQGDGGPGADSGPPIACTLPADCPSKICTNRLCAPPGPKDGVQNGDETDVDCGGSAPKCDVQKKCKVGGDCTSGVCTDAGQGLQCQPPSPTDGAKNGDETDVDCGGTKAPKCVDGKGCAARSDCASDVCTANVCATPICNDGSKNGTETGIDCGGAGCPRCDTGQGCLTGDDCASGVCKDTGAGLQCQAPSPTDGVKNADETDIDCGGTAAPKCAVAKACKVHADCQSDGCDYNGKCAVRRSCTGHYGGDTCGGGGAGGQGAQSWESCCATAAVSTAANGTVKMDKYKITSGRMREFLTRVNGDVRNTVRALRAAGKVPTVAGAGHSVIDPAWDLYLPTTMQGCDQDGTCDTHPNPAGGTDTELSDHFFQDTTTFKGIYTSGFRHVGASLWRGQLQTQQGCRVDAPGTHTYWMDATTQSNYFGDKAAEFGQTEYDVKPLQCGTELIYEAFCLWDGGRLETVAEWLAAIGPSTYPWGSSPTAKAQSSSDFYAHRFPDATDATLGLPSTTSIEYADYSYSYEYPHLVSTDFMVFINAPGRLPKGNGPLGHADLAYTLFENTADITTWTADPNTAQSQWANNGSWEGHGYTKGSFAGTVLDKYGKMGARCVYP
jgi:hypothetical protein